MTLARMTPGPAPAGHRYRLHAPFADRRKIGPGRHTFISYAGGPLQPLREGHDLGALPRLAHAHHEGAGRQGPKPEMEQLGGHDHRAVDAAPARAVTGT